MKPMCPSKLGNFFRILPTHHDGIGFLMFAPINPHCHKVHCRQAANRIALLNFSASSSSKKSLRNLLAAKVRTTGPKIT